MPRRRNNRRKARRGNGNGNGNVRPQSSRALIDLSKFDPTRRIKVATEASITSANPTLVLGMSANTPPGTGIAANETYIQSFDRTRICQITVYFDQRGSGSTASQPRCTAWIANNASSAYSAAKITSLARFAGSGLNTMIPGKTYRIAVPPTYNVGRFDFSGANTQATLIIATADYVGTVRIETTFQTYGPPFDYNV